MSDCSARLAAAKNALHALQIGDAIASVTVNGRSTTYTQANVSKLRTYISELESECGADTTRGRRAAIRFYG